MCEMRSSKVFELIHQERLNNMICLLLSWEWKHSPKIKAAAGKIYIFYPRLRTPLLLGMTLRNSFFCCMSTWMFLKLAPVVDSSKEALSCLCVKCSEKSIQIISYGFFHRTGQIFLLKHKLKPLHLKHTIGFWFFHFSYTTVFRCCY